MQVKNRSDFKNSGAGNWNCGEYCHIPPIGLTAYIGKLDSASMIYRPLGDTGLRVSQLGFGAMRLPMTWEEGPGKGTIIREQAIPMIHRAFEAGMNYIDTAVGYCNSDSQRVVGEALKGWRDRIIVSTKNPYLGDDEKSWWQNLEDSLERLSVEFIDIYNHHGINWKSYRESIEPRVGKWMAKARDQGLVKHVCFSFHDNNENLRKLVDTGYGRVVTLQYNLLDRQLEDGIAYACEKGMGVVVMGPVAGGRLGDNSSVLSSLVPGLNRVPELALRFVMSNPGVSVALSGMSTMEHVVENLAIGSDQTALSPSDRAAIDEHLTRLRKMADLYCTGCQYCMPCEAADVNIPAVFEYYNRGKIYGLWESARQSYGNIGKESWFPKGKRADSCLECGECEDKCPQKIPIRDQLQRAHEALVAA